MKTVRIAELKANLSRHLRGVRRGHPLTVLDRDTPIAVIVPYREASPELPVRRPLRALREVELPAPLEASPDSLAALREERAEG